LFILINILAGSGKYYSGDNACLGLLEDNPELKASLLADRSYTGHSQELTLQKYPG